MFAEVPGDESQGNGEQRGCAGNSEPVLAGWEKGADSTMLPQLLFLRLGDC